MSAVGVKYISPNEFAFRLNDGNIEIEAVYLEGKRVR